MSKKNDIPGRRDVILAAICFVIALILMIWYSYTSPTVRLEHFYFSFGILGSLATALTLYFLLVQYNQAQREKNETENISQASKVSSWLNIEREVVGRAKVTLEHELIVISNKSDLPIFNVVLSIVDGRHSDTDGRKTSTQFQRYIHIVPPGDGVIFAPQGYKGMGFVGAIEIGFEDSKNRSWVRQGNGSLKEISESSFKYYDVSLPPSFDTIQFRK